MLHPMTVEALPPNPKRHQGHVGLGLIFIEEPPTRGVTLEGLLLWRMELGHTWTVHQRSRLCRGGWLVARFIRWALWCPLMNSRSQSICHSRVNVQLMSLFHGGLSPVHARGFGSSFCSRSRWAWRKIPLFSSSVWFSSDCGSVI